MTRSVAWMSIALMHFPVLSGCTSEPPTSVVEGTDHEEIEAYKALIAAEEQAVRESMQEPDPVPFESEPAP